MKIEQIWQELQTEKVIGKGSYGTVYKCFRENNGEKTYSAVKVISIPQTGEEYYGYNTEGMTIEQTKEYYRDIVDDFANEIKILESLKGNKNIVEIKNYKVIEKTEEIGWEIFIEMELLTDFNTYASDKKFTEDEVLKLGMDLCNALYVCNEKNIIHRDIKPENIFVSENGDFKLGDFGVSRQLEKTDASMSRKGTFNYMAPEVFYSKKYDSRADVYSLGLVMYKLLNNNRMPFLDPEKQIVKYSERQEAFDKRINGEKIQPINGISDELNEVILKACEYKAEDRYNSADEFKKALEKRKLTGFAGWLYRHKIVVRASVIALVVLSLSVSVAIALKFGDEDKSIFETMKDGITDLFYSDTMASGKEYTSEAVEGKYIYASKNGVFSFDEATEKTTQLYDKASNGPAYDGGKITFISDEKTAIYQTELESETPEKIFSSEELSLCEVLFFDDECIIATSSKTEGEETSYDLVFIDVASSTYEQISELGDDTYAVYADGNIVYLKNAVKGTSGCEMYAYNIGNRESVLLAADAYACEDFAHKAENGINYLAKEKDDSALTVKNCSFDAKTNEDVTKEIKSCKDIIWWDSSNVIYVNEDGKSNIYNIEKETVTEVKEKVEEVYTYDGKYYAFEKFDDGYRLNEVCADGNIKASMYTDNIKNQFDVITLKKDKFLSWNNDLATFTSVKTNGIDPMLVDPTEADWRKFEEESIWVIIGNLNLKNYDCKEIDSKSFLFNYVLEEYGQSDMYSYFFDDEIWFDYSENPDPKQRFKYYPGSSADTTNGKYNGSYTKLSAEKIEWMAEQIFNIDYEFVDDLSIQKGQYEYGFVLEPYYDNGYYYFHNADGGDGVGFDLNVKEKKYRADGKVSVNIDMLSDVDIGVKIGSFSVIVGFKNLNNRNYWSVYSLQTDASISDLERLEYLENEATEKDVVYPNFYQNEFRFQRDNNNDVGGIDLYVYGDYDGSIQNYSGDIGQITLEYEDAEGIVHKDVYNYSSSDEYDYIIDCIYYTYSTEDVGMLYPLSEESYQLSYGSHDAVIVNYDGYSVVYMPFGLTYSGKYFEEISNGETNMSIEITLYEGVLSNSDYQFVNDEHHTYTFYKDPLI